MGYLKIALRLFVVLFILQNNVYSQCPAPSINAQVGTGPSTTICSGQCANLTASVVPPPNSTTNYSVAGITYSTYPYFGGSNAFATTLDDTWSDIIDIGFNFCYFGNTYNKLVVGSNGEITFNLASANQPESWVCSQVLPNLIEHPPYTICGPYRDYDPYPGGVIRTYTTGVAPCRAFVVYWSSVTLYSCATPLSSFQIVLYENSNVIGVNIQNSTACVSWNNGRGLVGIQNGTGTFAVAPPTRNVLTPWTAINESWRFTPTAAPVYNVNWAGPSGFTASGLTAMPCPTATGNYTATMSYCSGSVSSVVQVLVNTPTLVASASSSTICPPSSVTLTGSGATSYTWQTPSGSVPGSTTVVSPTVTTTYTLLGSNGLCTGSKTVQVTVNTAPAVSAFNLSGTVCPGNPVQLVATGALTYTWLPGSINGNIVIVNPTVTTTYTVNGSAGGCNGQATVIANVSNGPTITTVASPTAICTGGSATLSASGAVSYTWNPGGTISSSIAVSPTVTTTYSVTGADALTCTSTKTISLVVSPVPTVNISPASPSICIGTSATLTGSGASSYTWNPGGSNATSIVVSPATNTTYTLVGSNGTCTNSAITTLTVVPIPTVGASSSTTSICSGSSLTLTGSGASTYTWNPGNLVGTNVTVSPTITTTYTVVGSAGSCTSSAVVSVTVNNGPAIIANASPAVICPGNSSTLTASGALSYTWNPGSTIGSSLVVTPAITTNYSVTGNNAFGCTTTQTVSVTVSPVPTVVPASSSSSICIGSNATLTATGASTYTWNPGALTGSNIVVSPATTTTYTVIGSNGTCTNSATIGLTVVPIPTVSASSSTTSICAGSSLTLTGSGATTYTWNPGNLVGTNVTVSPTITTTYTVIGASGTCTSNAVISVTVNNGPVIVASASPTIVCAGSSSTLTATGALTYTWNPGALTGNTINVTPASTTVYSVTGANGFGCTTTQTVNLTVTPNPTITASASSASVCIGSSTTLTANGATTYTWNPGALTGSNVVVTPTANTTYTVNGTTLGCPGQSTITINVVPIPTVTAVTNPTAICNGSSATLTASGATSYTWMPGSLTGTSVVVSPTTTITYTVTGNNGSCSSPSTVNLVVNPSPTITASPTPTSICVSGNVTLTASGASTYTWLPGSSTGSSIVVSPTITTNYTVTGTSAFGCTNTSTTTVVVNTVPVLTLAATPTAVCNGFSSTLTALGATNYTWMPGSLTGSNVVVTPTVTTNYTVTGATGACSATQTITLIVYPNPTVTASASPTNICAGSSSTLTANGAVTYTWMPGSLTGATVAVTPTATTVYTVTGSTALGCNATTTVNLLVTPLPTITAVANPTAVCIGNSSTLTANGATTYTWNPGALTGSAVVVSPAVSTTYTINGTSGICSTTQTLNLVVNPSPTVIANASPASICAGQSTTLTSSGAVTYTWMPGSMTGSLAVVSPTLSTTYTVTGTNAFGCTNTGTVSVIVNPLPTLSVTSTATNICSGASATLTGSGGVSYFWNPGGIPGNPVTVSPSVTTTYTLFGTSGAGCVNTTLFTLSVTPVPTITAVSNPTAICIGNSATLTANGAASYTWNPGSLTGSNVVVSPAINTTYTITGANGFCVNTQTVSVNVNSLPTLTATANAATICAGMSSTLTGTGASTYTWNPGSLTGSNVVVSPAISTTYSVVGTNSLGCTNATTVIVTVNPLPTLTITSTATTICSGASATLTGSGAGTYTWNPGGTNATTLAITPTTTSTYTLTGTSAAGCTNTAMFTLSVTPVPTITAVANPTAICIGNSSTLTANGAASYTWMPGSLTGSNVVVTPVINTTYTITGANGFCVNTQTVSVNVNSLPTLTATSNAATICAGMSSTLNASGASTYTWNPGSLTGSNVVVSPVISTTYTVTGTNTLGCINTKTVSVTVNPLPTLTITSTATTICSSGSATLTASGAASYSWAPVGTIGSTLAITPSTTTTYTLYGMSAAGCTNSAMFTLSVVPVPTITAVANPTTVCAGSPATLTANGATTYTWNPGALTGSNVVVTPTLNTTYTVTGANGVCVSTQTVNVNVIASPTIIAGTTNPTICAGGTTTLIALGGTTYTWMPGSLPGAPVLVTPTITTTYTVTGSNLAGCTGTAAVTITVSPLPSLTIASTSTALCNGNTATLTGSGANTYTWNPGSATTSTLVITPTLTTTYSLTGASIAGCVNTNTITINVNTTPTVTASASSTSLCSGNSSTLTASGATTYTWNPGALTGSNVVVTPSVNTTYTVIGANGTCTTSISFGINVSPSPTISIVSNPTVICSGNTAIMIGSGALTYTWLPFSSNNPTVTVNPSATTTYTLNGSGANGCIGTALYTLSVTPTPTVTALANSSAVCIGNSSTLTANGATSYTWMPGSLTGSNVVVSPTITTSYTVTGVNGNCSNSTVVTVTVNTLPTVTASASPTIVCAGSTVTLTAGGANTYTWLPAGGTGSTVTTTPTITTTYTVTGSNSNGCTNSAAVTVSVNALPNVIAVSNPTSICAGSTSTLIAGGANTYTWNPGNITGGIITVTPAATTNYTVTGTDLIGCTATATLQLLVLPTPTVTAVSSTTAICIGTSATITANGALTYSWQPGASTGSVIVVTPTTTTAYTVTGANGVCGTATAIITVPVNLPPTVTASTSGTITCSTPSVDLLGSSSATNAGYSWNGPGSFTSSVQSPTGIPIPGSYTLTVIDISTGCSASNTTAVVTDSSIPTITATASGTVTCANPAATLTAASSSTNSSVMWTGPGSFTNSAFTFTTGTGGTYTVTVTDLTSNCPASTIVIVTTNTAVPITATIIPATCSGTMANNDGSIFASGYGAGDKYDLVSGLTYTGSVTYATAIVIPGSGMLINTLNNPPLITPYTVRFFAANGCTKDTTLFLIPTSCITNTVFGVAKAVSTPTVKPDGTYDVNYFVVIKNTGAQQLNNIALTENLAATFPLPTTYSIVTAPVVTSMNSSISINAAFDGSVQTVMTNTTLSTIAPGKTDTIMFTVNLTHNGNFGPFNNTVLGFASPTIGVVFGDSSNTGYDTDPDLDGDPTNNNIPTILNLPPKLFFGLTKAATLSDKLDDNTWDITYTVTVHNLGNDTLKNVVVKDSLFNNTIRLPATYSIKSGPTATGSLVVNTSFNGNSDINLLNASQSVLPPGSVNSIVFTINVNPDTITIVKNSAYGTAINTTSITVSDTSNAGINPDINGNGVWNEPSDNVPTILSIPNSSLFIPGGFSPDGDGKNDFFVIKGLSSGIDNTFTVYNRWGNKVYSKNNYDNTWNGYPNVSGTLGNQKLPQGTYYYTLDFKTGDNKTMYGFIVIQY